MAPEVCTALVYLQFQYTAESNSIISLCLDLPWPVGRQTVNILIRKLQNWGKLVWWWINDRSISLNQRTGDHPQELRRRRRWLVVLWCHHLWTTRRPFALWRSQPHELVQKGIIIVSSSSFQICFPVLLRPVSKQISRAEYTCPDWFSDSQKQLISRILDPSPLKVPSQTPVTWCMSIVKQEAWALLLPAAGYAIRDHWARVVSVGLQTLFGTWQRWERFTSQLGCRKSIWSHGFTSSSFMYEGFANSLEPELAAGGNSGGRRKALEMHQRLPTHSHVQRSRSVWSFPGAGVSDGILLLPCFFLWYQTLNLGRDCRKQSLDQSTLSTKRSRKLRSPPRMSSSLSKG